MRVSENPAIMDTPFVYDRFVTGKNFIGRKTECGIMQNLLERFENIRIYEPPKAGKTSTIQQSLTNMRLGGKQFVVVQAELFNVRRLNEFLIKFGSALIRPIASTPAEYEQIVSSHLGSTHFVFDPNRFSSCDEVVSLNWDADYTDIEEMLRLPARISAEKGVPVYVVLDEFQNLMMMPEKDWENIFKALETVMKENRESANPPKMAFILSGSGVNAMKYIFEEKKYFYRLTEHIALNDVDNREIIEHIVRGFLSSGKVIERDLVLGATQLFRCNMWYLNHFTSICDSLSKGYMNEGILMEALNSLISIHEPKFTRMVDDFTDHQLNFILAVLDGVKKFSSTEVIEKYGFNSSANVRRLKDALKKKEIITFNENDEPVVLDPLFEYWLRKTYFGK